MRNLLCTTTMAAVASVLSLACVEDTPTSVTDLSPTCIPAQEATAETGGFILYAPNGCETFRVGDTIAVRFGHLSNPYFYTEAVLELMLSSGDLWMMAEFAVFDLHGDTAQWKGVIPDSIYDGVSVVPFPTGDRIKVRVGAYEPAKQDFDYSDGYLAIVSR